MIKNYSDHAASERTFLAWVRTSIGIMAFGFLIERFDLVLRYAAAASGFRIVVNHEANNIAGLVFIVLGIAMICIAAYRFVVINRAIDQTKEIRMSNVRLDVAFAALLILMSAAMFMFLFRTFTSAL